MLGTGSAENRGQWGGALARDPHFLVAPLQLSALQLELSKLDQAASHLQQLMAKSPSSGNSEP